jgi:Spy/CpxP family protein refolding chaperone
MKKTVLSVTAVALISTSLYSFGGGYGEGFRGEYQKSRGEYKRERRDNRGGHHIMRVVSQISDISEKQMEKIGVVMRSSRDAMKAMKDFRRKEVGISQFISKNGFDKDGFKKASEEFSAQKSEFKAENIKNVLDVLTPKQREEFKSLLKEEEASQEFRPRREFRRPPPPPIPEEK